MNPDEMLNIYFKPGTKGYRILYFYFTRYRELFMKTNHHQLDEFINQIFLNVSGIRFSEEIKNLEAYIIGTIKIQCRVQLDLAIKMKNRKQKENENIEKDNEDKSVLDNLPGKEPNPHSKLESTEVFSLINIFKLSLKESERDLFNSLIEDVPRKEIAEKKNQNLNTVDTQIRRLRIKIFSFLKEKGYTFKMFSKYDIN